MPREAPARPPLLRVQFLDAPPRVGPPYPALPAVWRLSRCGAAAARRPGSGRPSVKSGGMIRGAAASAGGPAALRGARVFGKGEESVTSRFLTWTGSGSGAQGACPARRWTHGTARRGCCCELCYLKETAGDAVAVLRVEKGGVRPASRSLDVLRVLLFRLVWRARLHKVVFLTTLFYLYWSFSLGKALF